MIQSSMISTVICDTCQNTLRHGDIGGKVEYKTCIPCVTRTTPAADPNKIKKPPQVETMAESVQRMNREQQRAKQDKKNREKNLSVEVESSIVIQDSVALFTLNFTLGKLKKFDVGFTKEQLMDFLEDLKKVEAEEALNNK